MVTIYQVGLFTLLISEYGFQSRRDAIHGFKSRWSRRRSLFRALLWGVMILANEWYRTPRLLLIVLLFYLIGEGIALFLHLRLRRDMEGAHPFGAPWVHILPFLLSLLFPAIAYVTTMGRIGISVVYPSSRLLAVGNVLTLLWTWATLFTVSVVQVVRPEQLKQELGPAVGAGELIGVLERYITLVLIAAGGAAAVGFVIAVKAAVRYPQFTDKAFAEYFLIGTLCSVGLAILGALALAA